MGSLIGQFTGRVLIFQWIEQKRSGFSLLILNEDENQLHGIWGDENIISGTWSAEKLSGKISQCEEDPLVAQLIRENRAVLFIPNLKSSNPPSRSDLKRLLQDIPQFLARHPDYKLMLEAHTDAAGEPSANEALSEIWAIEVKNILVESGIEESRMTIQAFGDSMPIASNQTLTGRSANNRIELIIE